MNAQTNAQAAATTTSATKPAPRRASFRENVSLDIAVNFCLEATLVDEFVQLALIDGVVKVGGYPLNAIKRLRGATAVLTSRGSDKVSDDAFYMVPKVVVGMGRRGCVGVEDFVEVGDNCLVVGSDQDGMKSMLDNMSDSGL